MKPYVELPEQEKGKDRNTIRHTRISPPGQATEWC
jgi:hypothetical protein